MEISFRSPNVAHGFFNSLGSAHVHIDGSQNPELILRIIKELDAQGNVGKLNVVYDFISGRQREILPETYKSHTPLLEDKETLDFFSTNIVKDRLDAIKIINFINDLVKNTPGIIIELEQLVGLLHVSERQCCLGYTTSQWVLPEDYIQPITSTEVLCTPRQTEAFEIHHGFTTQISEKPLIPLDVLNAFCDKNGIIVGGWFIFKKEDGWAYRSNSFTNGAKLFYQVEHEQSLLLSFITQFQIHSVDVAVHEIRTYVEKVIGIWHS